MCIYVICMYIYIYICRQKMTERHIYIYVCIYIYTHTQMYAVVIVCMCVQVRFTETNSQKLCGCDNQQQYQCDGVQYHSYATDMRPLDSLGIPAHQYGALWLKASLRAVPNPKHPSTTEKNQFLGIGKRIFS